jgi:transcriptional regulator with XRE-family HTH domain
MKKDILKKFGDKVRELRLEKGWSQEQLAEETGFHRTYIGMVERGERNLSLKNVEIFANTFKISMNLLFKDF